MDSPGALIVYTVLPLVVVVGAAVVVTAIMLRRRRRRSADVKFEYRLETKPGAE
jgi:hypothetical protein